MKVMCFTFSIYLLVLACLSCKDTKNAFAETKVQEIVSAIDQPIDFQHHQEACSPFCCCSCCQITTSVPIAFISLPHPLFFSDIFVPRDLPTARDIPLPIWQPPKIKC